MTRARPPGRRSEHELKRLVEEAVSDACDLDRARLAFHVDAVEVRGRPPERLIVWATLHFLAGGGPFCCGETGCHLALRERHDEINERVRRSMGLRDEVVVDLDDARIGVSYHDGVAFRVDDATGSASKIDPA